MHIQRLIAPEKPRNPAHPATSPCANDFKHTRSIQKLAHTHFSPSNNGFIGQVPATGALKVTTPRYTKRLLCPIYLENSLHLVASFSWTTGVFSSTPLSLPSNSGTYQSQIIMQYSMVSRRYETIGETR